MTRIQLRSILELNITDYTGKNSENKICLFLQNQELFSQNEHFLATPFLLVLETTPFLPVLETHPFLPVLVSPSSLCNMYTSYLTKHTDMQFKCNFISVDNLEEKGCKTRVKRSTVNTDL